MAEFIGAVLGIAAVVVFFGFFAWMGIAAARAEDADREAWREEQREEWRRNRGADSSRYR